MSRPNFENIDRWFFEYTEGNLSVDQESEFLDFLNLHPELMSELKAWNSAKVKTPILTPFPTQNLVKPVPLLYRPFALISIGFLAILLSWFGFTLIPTTPLYTKAKIDTEIIDTEFDNTDLFVDQLIAMTNNKSKDNNPAKDNGTPTKTIKALHNNHLQTEKITEVTSNKSTFKEKLNHYSEEQIEVPNLNIENSLEDKADLNSETVNTAENHFSIRSNELDLISDYLNSNKGGNTKSEIKVEDDLLDLASSDNNSKTSASSNTTKSSVKKSLNSSLRKIKRMADYPVAMQNTKNPHFHAPMMSGYKANFAMVGTAAGNRIQATSRYQWINETNAQLMNSLSWDGYVYAVRGGVGIDVNYNNYQHNDLNNYSAALTYSPKLSINKKVSLEPAIRMKMGVINLDQQSNSIGNLIELERRNIVSLFESEQKANGKQLWYRDIGLGFMFNTEWFYLGFNADNLGRHNNNFYSADLNKEYKSNIHYTAVMGSEYISKSRDIRLSGYALYQKYGELNELWLGTNLQYKWLQFGVGINSNTDLAASLGTTFKHYSLHYNIDFTESRLLNKKRTSHQLTMRILLKPSRYVAKFLKL